MVGSKGNPGIMHLTVNELFKRFQKLQVVVKASYLEIYNETIIDLLCPESKNLDLREDPSRGVCIAGISERRVYSVQEI